MHAEKNGKRSIRRENAFAPAHVKAEINNGSI